MKVVVATHVYAPGPAQELKKYLLGKKVSKLLFIGHPLLFLKRLDGPGYEVFVEGRLLVKNYRKIRRWLVGVISYPGAIISNIVWTLKYDGKWDLYVGCNNLNALSGVLLKKLGVVKKTVYYVVDYNPDRFSNNMLNKIYHKIELYCAQNCDETWNLSPRMIEARQDKWKMQLENQKVVPMGAWLDRIEEVSYEDCLEHTAVFMGHVLEKQGVQLVIKGIPKIVKEIPNFKLRVIGLGPYLENLKGLTSQLKVEAHVDFLGFVEDVKRDQLIGESALAIALYNPESAAFTYFADPGKVRNYLGAGVPVLITDVPLVSQEIKENNAGLVVEYDINSISEAITETLTDLEKVRVLRENALSLGRKYDWNQIYGKLGII